MPVAQSHVPPRPSAPDRQRWRPRPVTRKLITVVHVVSSVALVGVVWGLVLLNLTATLTGDGITANSAYRMMSVLIFGGGTPLGFIALVSGILLAVGSRWGLARHYWVFAKLLLLLAAFFVGRLLFTPEAMAEATAGGAGTSAGRQWAQVAVVSCQLAMLLTATALSVFKPRGRIGWRRPAVPVRLSAARSASRRGRGTAIETPPRAGSSPPQ